MTLPKKQPKINKFFHRKTNAVPVQLVGGDEVDEELEQLKETLKKKQNELFQLQRNSFKLKLTSPKEKEEEFVKPERIMKNNSITNIRQELELMTMLSGMEVQSYVADDHCAIVFHLQHDSEYQIKHGLRIDMRSGENKISQSSLPFGFNLTAVLDSYDNVMVPECLGAVRKALVAYYDRLEQYEALKNMLNIDAQLIRNVDGTHIEVTFAVRSELDASESNVTITLVLDFRLYDIRVKQYSFLEFAATEPLIDALIEQCSVFKRKTLVEAFESAFIDGVGPYLIKRQFGVVPEVPGGARRGRRHKRRQNERYNKNDDTFRPEDCSNSEDDAD